MRCSLLLACACAVFPACGLFRSAPELPSLDQVRIAREEQDPQWQRLRAGKCQLCVQTLVLEVGEVDNSLGNRERASAVLVHPGARVEAHWRDVHRGT